MSTMNSITGTNHLAYYNGTACPITLPFDGLSWLKMAKEQYVKGVAYEGGNEEKFKEVLLGQMGHWEGELNRICAGGVSSQAKITEWGLAVGIPDENDLAILWYLNVYTLQYHLGVEIDNNFGILHINTKQKKQKKQKVNAKCACGSKKKYKVCCMNKSLGGV